MYSIVTASLSHIRATSLFFVKMASTYIYIYHLIVFFKLKTFEKKVQ